MLDIVARPGFLARVRELSDRFARDLAGLSFELRRRGLFMGMKLADEGEAITALGRLLGEGVFVFPAGNDRSVLQFLPPLIISDDETDELIARIHRAFP